MFYATRSESVPPGCVRALGRPASGMRSACKASDRPTCYPCPADPVRAGSHYAFIRSMSRQANAPNLQTGVCPGGVDGRAPLTKVIGEKGGA